MIGDDDSDDRCIDCDELVEDCVCGDYNYDGYSYDGEVYDGEECEVYDGEEE